MCNCGNKRNDFAASSNAASPGAAPKRQAAEKILADINFIYTGQSALSVTGNVTGRRYRFNTPSAQQPVDYRDAPFIMTVPVLKKVVVNGQ